MRTLPTLLRACVLLLHVAFIAGCSTTSSTNPNASANAFSIQPAAASVAVGGTVPLQATLATNGTRQNVTGQTTWAVSDPSIATVENNVLKSKSVGTITVNGTFNGTSTASTSLTITPAAPVITWSHPADVPAATTLSSTQLAAQANVPGTFTYNPAAGTALQSGTQTLTANFTPSDSTTYSSATASTTINVSSPAPVGTGPAPVGTQTATLASIQISGVSTVGRGASVQLKATGTYADKTTKDITSDVSWASSQQSVATIQGGLATGVGAGTSSVTGSLSGVTGSTAIEVTSGYVVQIDPSMSQSQIQSKLDGSQSGDTISFAAGTYKLASPGLNIPAGRIFLGSTTGTTMLSGTGGYTLMVFYGDGLTLQNFTFDGGGLFLGGAVTDLHIEYNTFQNINGPFGSWPAEIAITMDTSAANSDISYNKFTNIGGDLLNQFVDEVFAGGIFGKGLSNTTIEYNTFDTFNEGIHIFYDNLDGKNVHINNNTFVHGHRIAIEQQDGKAGGLEVAYNKVSEPLNGWALTYGLSIAASSDSGTGITVHDNLVNADTPVGAACKGSGCYYPYGIEAWGTGTQVYNNTVEGLWGHGVAIGAASNLSITKNTICGPSMAQNNSFVDFEYGSEPGTTIQDNTTSADMTCGAGK